MPKSLETWTVHSGQKGLKASSRERTHASIPIISNDPTAGSPTVTLLRLLVPLNDQV